MSARPAPDALARAAGLAAATVLWTVAFVHAVWAAGSSWPAGDSDRLADLVVGRQPFPSSTVTWIVTACLAAAGGIIAWRAGITPLGGFDQPLARYTAFTIAAVFLLRGAGGLAVSGFALIEATGLFRHWDLRLYSPLCLLLGSACTLVALRPPASNGRQSR